MIFKSRSFWWVITVPFKLSTASLGVIAVHFGKERHGSPEVGFGDDEDKFCGSGDELFYIDAGAGGDGQEREKDVRHAKHFRPVRDADGGEVVIYPLWLHFEMF